MDFTLALSYFHKSQTKMTPLFDGDIQRGFPILEELVARLFLLHPLISCIATNFDLWKEKRGVERTSASTFG